MLFVCVLGEGPGATEVMSILAHWEYFWPPRMALEGKSSARKRKDNNIRRTEYRQLAIFLFLPNEGNGMAAELIYPNLVW